MMRLGSENRQVRLSKIATNDGHGENTPYFDGWKAYDRNPFHPTNNPEGVIQMGLAENLVIFFYLYCTFFTHFHLYVCIYVYLFYIRIYI